VYFALTSLGYMSLNINNAYSLLKLSKLIDKVVVIVFIFVLYSETQACINIQLTSIFVLITFLLKLLLLTRISYVNNRTTSGLNSIYLYLKYITSRSYTNTLNPLQYRSVYTYLQKVFIYLKKSPTLRGYFFWYPLFKKNSYYGFSRTVKTFDHFFKKK